EQLTVISFFITIGIISVFVLFSYFSTHPFVKDIMVEKIAQWGDEGELDFPFGLAVTPDNRFIYISNVNSNEIRKYKLPDNNENWVLIKRWGKEGDAHGEFNQPSGICLDVYGNLYVADAYNGRIQKFNSEGEYISEINYSKTGFWRPRNVFVGLQNMIYVANTGKFNMCQFDYSGKMLYDFVDMKGEVFGIIQDKEGFIYVANSGTKTIDILSDYLVLKRKVKVPAYRQNIELWPMLAIDSKQRIYAVSQFEQQIWIYEKIEDKKGKNLKLIGIIKKDINNKPLFSNPVGIAIDSKDDIYISEKYKNVIIKIRCKF
ncbi:MAG: NHL repeat-containing protein, partial [Candidatus Goldbacteria bacterium]|nr:NHL repeat-containing protein [Candidatus Goldiibacteriota bacterium]